MGGGGGVGLTCIDGGGADRAKWRHFFFFWSQGEKLEAGLGFLGKVIKNEENLSSNLCKRVWGCVGVCGCACGVKMELLGGGIMKRSYIDLTGDRLWSSRGLTWLGVANANIR